MFCIFWQLCISIFHFEYFVICSFALYFMVFLQWICFRIFCSKHSITFDAYLLNCQFHCVDIFYTNFRSCETFTVKNSTPVFFLIELLSNFRIIKCWFILYLQMHVLGQCKFKCIIYPTRLFSESHSISLIFAR